MRRRIDLFDVRDVSDQAANWFEWPDEEGGEPVASEFPDPVLRDEWLWNELRVARQHVEELEAAVRRACKPEPLTDVEKEVGAAMWKLLRDHTSGSSAWIARWDVLRDKLRKANEEEP